MKSNYIDEQEKQEMEIWDGVEINQVKNDAENIDRLRSAAKQYVKKHETKMNIRISQEELEKIKQRAAQEGLKYQTFIKSVLHKYMTGQLVEDKGKIA